MNEIVFPSFFYTCISIFVSMNVKNKIKVKSKVGTIAVSEEAERLVIEEVARLNIRGIPANKKSVTSSVIVNSLGSTNGKSTAQGLTNNLTAERQGVHYEN
jgi:hypothetical protein